MANLISIQELSLEYPNRVIFDRVSLGVAEGDRIGIVGRNGDGKSTLLKLIAGTLEPNSGLITKRTGLRIGFLDQQHSLDPEESIEQAVLGGLAEHEWAADPKVREILAGLLQDLDWTSKISALSGGQQRRVQLAKLLIEDHDVLMLDEPTNHLDVVGINWLASHLKRRWSKSDGALLVVTHDRWFLDEISETTWEVYNTQISQFEGGYAAYVLQRVERDRQAAVSETKRQNLMRKELAWLRRGAPARTSKPKFRIEAANQLIADVPPIRDSVELAKLSTSRQGKDVVELIGASFSYPEKLLLQETDWVIGPGDRIGILGKNGSGKSTLIQLITGELSPSAGRVKHGKTLNLALLSQQLDELKEFEELRISEVIARYKSSYQSTDKELSPSQLLNRLGFQNDQFSTRIKELSGGQRRRLQLLLIFLEEPNLLILDEPTNDLDTDILAAMEDLLDSWPGTLIVVSHDRYFLERATDQHYSLIDAKLQHLPGGVEQYLKLIDQSARGANNSTLLEAKSSQTRTTPANSDKNTATSQTKATLTATDSSPATSATTDSSTNSSTGAFAKSTSESATNLNTSSTVKPVAALSGADRRTAEKELAAIERKTAKLQEELAQQNEKIAAHDQSDYTGLSELVAKQTAIFQEVETLELRWLELAELLG